MNLRTVILIGNIFFRIDGSEKKICNFTKKHIALNKLPHSKEPTLKSYNYNNNNNNTNNKKPIINHGL